MDYLDSKYERFIAGSALVFLLAASLASPAVAGTLYVWQESPSPTTPFTNWATAAHVIQDAVDAAQTGDTVLVTNGVYATGGRAAYPHISNRVAVDKPITLLSVNGPDVTGIKGYQVPGATNSNGAIRCVYLTNGAVLSGFSLTKGAADIGGGLMSDWAGLASNCVISGNSAISWGGGFFGGWLINCTLTSNSAYGGGGAFYCWLRNCTLTANSATYGGGVAGSYDFESMVVNCTLTGNSAAFGGGSDGARLENCVVYYNSSSNASPNYTTDWGTMNYSCTMPAWEVSGWQAGVANITNEPLFVDAATGNLRLQSNSPCINAGTNDTGLLEAPGPTDRDGNPRIVNGTVDMGAYEWQVPVRFAPLRPPGIAGMDLSFSGEMNRVYDLYASSNLVGWFWLSRLTNQTGQASATDPLSTPPPARFYKVAPVP